MLPDYPETKKLYERFFQTHMRRKARELSPLLGSVRIRHLHEGRDMNIVREDQSESNTKTQLFTATGEVKIEDIRNMTFERAIKHHDDMVTDMVKQQMGYFTERMDDEIPESQAVDAKGKRLSAELIIEMLDKIQLEFYDDGRPHELHVIGGLFTPEALKTAEDELRNSPELKKRFDDLMTRKKELWRAREASRKLVG